MSGNDIIPILCTGMKFRLFLKLLEISKFCCSFSIRVFRVVTSCSDVVVKISNLARVNSMSV
jgi:hypothetical protein